MAAGRQTALWNGQDNNGNRLPGGDYRFEAVTKGVYVMHGPLQEPSKQNQGFMNNPAFVITDAGVVVVDPGSSVQTGEMVLRQVAKVTDKPLLAVLNTHVHGDHWLGNQAMREFAPEVPIYAHPKMLEAVEAGAGVVVGVAGRLDRLAVRQLRVIAEELHVLEDASARNA